jgi:uncharacterized membrane protein
MKRACVVAILILAFFGLADSIYLAQHALNGTPLLCTIQSLSDCNTVVTSSYSRIFGIPIAELGVLFYSIMFVLAALELVMYDQFLRRVLQAFSLVGILASLYFMFVQTFVIRAFCVYCLASAFIALLIFIFASMIEPIKRRTAPPVN